MRGGHGAGWHHGSTPEGLAKEVTPARDIKCHAGDKETSKSSAVRWGMPRLAGTGGEWLNAVAPRRMLVLLQPGLDGCLLVKWDPAGLCASNRFKKDWQEGISKENYADLKNKS